MAKTGRRGRPPKPIEQREREGNPGKRPLPPALKIDGRLPVKPAGLGEHGERFWNEAVETLTAAGITQRIDTPALTMMAAQWELAEASREILAREGHYALGSTGQLVEHPAIGIMHRAHAAFLTAATEFGMTAAARSRIAAALAGAQADLAQAEADAILDLNSPAEV